MRSVATKPILVLTLGSELGGFLFPDTLTLSRPPLLHISSWRGQVFCSPKPCLPPIFVFSMWLCVHLFGIGNFPAFFCYFIFSSTVFIFFLERKYRLIFFSLLYSSTMYDIQFLTCTHSLDHGLSCNTFF